MFAKPKSQMTFFCNTAILHLFFPSYFKVGKITMFHHHFSIDFKLRLQGRIHLEKNISFKFWLYFFKFRLTVKYLWKKSNTNYFFNET